MYENNTCWEILGIAPIQDKKAIKRAYSKQLKITRPDEDPEGFKRLHTAYTECLDYLNYDWYWEDDEDVQDDEQYSDHNDEHSEQVAYQTNQTITLATPNEVINQSHANAADSDASGLDTNNTDFSNTDARNTDVSNMDTLPPPIATPKHTDTTVNHIQDDEELPLATATTADTDSLDVQDGEQEIEQGGEQSSNQDSNQNSDEEQIYLNQSAAQQAFSQNLTVLITSPIHRDDISKWQTLLTDDALYDISYKQQVSMQVLEEILDLRESQITQANNPKKLPPSFFSQPTLSYLSDFFGWQHAQEKIEDTFYYHDALNQFYDDLEPADAPILAEKGGEYARDEMLANQLGLASLHARFFAFVIDLGIIVFIGYVATQVSLYAGFELAIVWFIFFMLLIMAWLQAKSRYQASVGQRLLGLKMVNLQQQRISMLHAFWRFVFAMIVFIIALVTLKGVFGFVLWGAYFIDKYRNKSRYTWLDKTSETFVIKILLSISKLYLHF